MAGTGQHYPPPYLLQLQEQISLHPDWSAQKVKIYRHPTGYFLFPLGVDIVISSNSLTFIGIRRFTRLNALSVSRTNIMEPVISPSILKICQQQCSQLRPKFLHIPELKQTDNRNLHVDLFCRSCSQEKWVALPAPIFPISRRTSITMLLQCRVQKPSYTRTEYPQYLSA